MLARLRCWPGTPAPALARAVAPALPQVLRLLLSCSCHCPCCCCCSYSCSCLLHTPALALGFCLTPVLAFALPPDPAFALASARALSFALFPALAIAPAPNPRMQVRLERKGMSSAGWAPKCAHCSGVFCNWGEAIKSSCSSYLYSKFSYSLTGLCNFNPKS